MTKPSRGQVPAFEDLIHQLDMRTSAEDQKRFLAWWYARLSPQALVSTLAPTLAILLGRPAGQKVTVPALKKALFNRVNRDLFEASKDAGTDLSETLALLWPGGADTFDPEALVIAVETKSKA